MGCEASHRRRLRQSLFGTLAPQAHLTIINNKMAKANTYKMETGGYMFKTCCICEDKAIYRAFYYPTYMNGDAEWLGDYCEKHKSVDLKSLSPERVREIYKKYNKE